MTDNEFLLQDRLQKIRSINEQYNLEANAYLSFSGGRDSTILHHLLDEALPGNKIPRVFINTGIEYKLILKFVRELQKKDPRIIIYNSGVNIKKMRKNKNRKSLSWRRTRTHQSTIYVSAKIDVSIL